MQHSTPLQHSIPSLCLSQQAAEGLGQEICSTAYLYWVKANLYWVPDHCNAAYVLVSQQAGEGLGQAICSTAHLYWVTAHPYWVTAYLYWVPDHCSVLEAFNAEQQFRHNLRGTINAEMCEETNDKKCLTSSSVGPLQIPPLTASNNDANMRAHMCLS